MHRRGFPRNPEFHDPVIRRKRASDAEALLTASFPGDHRLRGPRAGQSRRAVRGSTPSLASSGCGRRRSTTMSTAWRGSSNSCADSSWRATASNGRGSTGRSSCSPCCAPSVGMYADHPQLVPLLVGKTITHPAVIAAYDDLASVLVDGGFADDEVLSVIAVIDAFAIGFVSRSRISRRGLAARRADTHARSPHRRCGTGDRPVGSHVRTRRRSSPRFAAHASHRCPTRGRS